MIRVGLTGNRFSGKKTVCSMFSDMGIPVFDADVITKFILAYDYEFLNELCSKIGFKYFKEDGSINQSLIERDGVFGEILSNLEKPLFNSYKRFEIANKNTAYNIFKSSVLYETGWDKKMETNITVYSPFVDRVERGKNRMNTTFTYINMLLRTEMDELDKNSLSDFVIHNYNEFDIKNQIRNIDKQLLNYYLQNGGASSSKPSYIKLNDKSGL